MPKGRPLKYILNSDFAVMKNDSNTVTVNVTVPSGDVISPASYRSYSADISVGAAGAPMEWQINYPIGTQKWLAPSLQVIENAFAANQYQGYVYIYRPTSTTARLQVDYFNPNAFNVNTNARTITATVRTFLPPF